MARTPLSESPVTPSAAASAHPLAAPTAMPPTMCARSTWVLRTAELRHVNAQSEPDLFWALRGGKGNFAVVTALEFDLFPVSRLYGGAIYFPGEQMADVLRAWANWHPSTPET